MIEGLQARMIAKSLSTALLAHQVNSGWFEEVEIHQVIFDNQEEENHLQMFLVPFDQPKVIKRTLLKKVLNNLNLLKKCTQSTQIQKMTESPPNVPRPLWSPQSLWLQAACFRDAHCCKKMIKFVSSRFLAVWKSFIVLLRKQLDNLSLPGFW